MSTPGSIDYSPIYATIRNEGSEDLSSEALVRNLGSIGLSAEVTIRNLGSLSLPSEVIIRHSASKEISSSCGVAQWIRLSAESEIRNAGIRNLTCSSVIRHSAEEDLSCSALIYFTGSKNLSSETIIRTWGRWPPQLSCEALIRGVQSKNLSCNAFIGFPGSKTLRCIALIRRSGGADLSCSLGLVQDSYWLWADDNLKDFFLDIAEVGQGYKRLGEISNDSVVKSSGTDSLKVVIIQGSYEKVKITRRIGI